MLNRIVPTTFRRSWSLVACRNLSLTTSLNQQPKQQQIVDPIQQLFVTKIREYNDKRKQSTDGLVDATPDVRKSLEETLNKLKHAYGGDTEDLLSVPKLTFKEPQLESVVEKQNKEISETDIKVSNEDLKTYTGALGAWNQNQSSKK